MQKSIGSEVSSMSFYVMEVGCLPVFRSTRQALRAMMLVKGYHPGGVYRQGVVLVKKAVLAQIRHTR